jgi:hypothetical protein
VTDLASLTAATFTPLLNGHFRISPDDAPSFEVELIQVAEAGHQGPRRTQFSLLFRGGPEQPLPQRIYRVEHDDLGALDLFLVPLGPDDVGQRYEAVFT